MLSPFAFIRELPPVVIIGLALISAYDQMAHPSQNLAMHSSDMRMLVALLAWLIETWLYLAAMYMAYVAVELLDSLKED